MAHKIRLEKHELTRKSLVLIQNVGKECAYLGDTINTTPDTGFILYPQGDSFTFDTSRFAYSILYILHTENSDVRIVIL